MCMSLFLLSRCDSSILYTIIYKSAHNLLTNLLQEMTIWRPQQQSKCQEMPFGADMRLFQATVEGHLFDEVGKDFLSKPGQQDLWKDQTFSECLKDLIF